MPQILRAGPLSLRYEAGEIRGVCWGKTEVLNRVYGAVRDHNWGTVPMEIEEETVFDGGDHFRVCFRATHRQGEIAFSWKGEISGERDGSLIFEFDGEAQSAFRSNRIGFCTLHPRSLAGTRATLTHPDGSQSEKAFPTLIAPHCPFENLAAMSFPLAPGVEAKLIFEGEVFEIEDQRNWIDASFKTYCTPLTRPFPVAIEAGTTVRQSIRLELSGQLPFQLPFVSKTSDSAISLRVGAAPCGIVPPIGLMMAEDEAPLSPREIEGLKPLHLRHLRVDVVLTAADWPHKLHRAREEAQAIGCALQIALFTGESPDFTPLLDALRTLEPEIASFLLFADKLRPATPEVFSQARELLRVMVPNARFGVGTDANFAELNRNRPSLDGADFVTYAANPQVHAFDCDSIMETPAALADTVHSARVVAQGKGVAISPLTLKPRFNAVATDEATDEATGPSRELQANERPANADARQAMPFGAAWTLASLVSLIRCELESLTLFETTGWRGVMSSERLEQEKMANSISTPFFPLYHVLAELADVHGATAFPLVSSNSCIVGIAFSDAYGVNLHILLANVSSAPQEIALAWPSSHAEMRFLSEKNSDSMRRKWELLATQNGVLRFQLSAYAVAHVQKTASDVTPRKGSLSG